MYKLRKEKEKAEKEKIAAVLKEKSGSFTPSQNEDSNTTTVAPTSAVVQALLNNNNSKPSSRTSKNFVFLLKGFTINQTISQTVITCI